MGDVKIVGMGTLQKGNFVVIEGVACKVTNTQSSKTGKHGHAKIRMEAIGIIDEKKRIIVAPAHDNIEVPIILKKTAQIMSISGTKATVMDVESYETFEMDIPEELKGQVTEGSSVMYWVILDQKVMKQLKGSE